MAQRELCVVIDTGFLTGTEWTFFGDNVSELGKMIYAVPEILPQTTDMYDLLVKLQVFSSKSQARKNWKKTGPEIPWGWSAFEQIGKLNHALYILKPQAQRKLWLDDDPEYRTPPDKAWKVCRTVDEAVALVESWGGVFEDASLDNDLGLSYLCDKCTPKCDDCPCQCHVAARIRPRGYDFICWLEACDWWPYGSLTIHTANPVDRAKMAAAAERHYERREDVMLELQGAGKPRPVIRFLERIIHGSQEAEAGIGTPA